MLGALGGSVECLRWVLGAVSECGGPGMGIEGFGVYGGPGMGIEGFGVYGGHWMCGNGLT